LANLQLRQPVVLALPRGGVQVAAEVAKALSAPLDLVIVRKVGAPGNPELAVAAIVDGDPPDIVLNREIVEAYSLDADELRALISEERPELERRRLAYRGSPPLSIAGKTAIIVDDGAATGTTMKVAIRALKPVASGDCRGYPCCSAGYGGRTHSGSGSSGVHQSAGAFPCAWLPLPHLPPTHRRASDRRIA
jgi:predicted phosphoribosyltransferase